MKSRLQWYSVWIMILLSAIYYPKFETSLGQFRFIHFFTIICYLLWGMDIIKNAKSTLNLLGKYSILIIVFIFFVYGPLTYLYSYDKQGTIKVMTGQWFNILIFFYCFSIFSIYRNRFYELKTVFYKIIVYTPFALGLHIFLSRIGVHFAKIIVSHGSLERPGLFFLDPNWCTFYLLLCYQCLFWICHKHKFSKVNFSKVHLAIVFSILLSQSRINLFIFFVQYYYFFLHKRGRNLFFVGLTLIACFFMAGLDMSSVFNEHTYYDIIDLERNPRLNDANNLIETVFLKNEEFAGMGWGALPYMKYSYENIDNEIKERYAATTINVLPAQIFFDFGYLGCIIFLFLFIKTVLKYDTLYMKYVYVSMIIFSCFHMIVYFQYFWVFMSLIIFMNRLDINYLNGKSK